MQRRADRTRVSEICPPRLIQKRIDWTQIRPAGPAFDFHSSFHHRAVVHQTPPPRGAGRFRAAAEMKNGRESAKLFLRSPSRCSRASGAKPQP
ncbi:hypothetical protein AAFF_G00217930 [Aldrovandia affinis]|uniref:Uncharacterized protein n=1 Tax=Aldrovandia affinis TaxID=143900 RepID=A0AAD7SVU0_9TELE|nr:hypothetical protein AAFF_G00217930 [Aldrovandia affinis]